MFGESESESSRSPSPWDSFTSSPEIRGIPKLVPEVEQGNVEYKLQILSPTPTRFARLVTQLNWRLLEGGGQAYYELGVADSGALVGLHRHQLEESLETLELMAGEIGASVIVVKEIEVPPELSSLAESQLERWDGLKRSARRKDLLRMMKRDAPLTTSTTDSEIESSHTEFTDAEDATSYLPSTSPMSPAIPTTPISFPFDPALALFTMDIGGNAVNDADIEAPDDIVPTDCITDFSTSLEIFSVYKPRPMKKRAAHSLSLPIHSKHTKKKYKNGYPPSRSVDTIRPEDLTEQGPFGTLSVPGEAGTQFHSGSRDLPTDPPNSLADTSCLADRPISAAFASSHFIADLPTDDVSEATPIVSKEPRRIVEALVVRKLLLDEGFLDFQSFSLQC